MFKIPLLLHNICDPIRFMFPSRQSGVHDPTLAMVSVLEQTFQGILLSPHNVNQGVLQRMHTETIKGSRSLLEKEEKTTTNVLNSCVTTSNSTWYEMSKQVCSNTNSLIKIRYIKNYVRKASVGEDQLNTRASQFKTIKRPCDEWSGLDKNLRHKHTVISIHPFASVKVTYPVLHNSVLICFICYR